MMTDQMFGMGATNTTSMMGMQQQQQQGVYGNMQEGAQNINSRAWWAFRTSRIRCRIPTSPSRGNKTSNDPNPLTPFC